MEIGNRIMIIGSGGAGKSTLARQLGEMLDLPVIHLDAHFWQSGWVRIPRDEWRGKVEQLMTGERWIMDGNYSGTMEMRLAVAQTVIFLDFPPLLCLFRVLKRRVQYHGKTRPDLNAGCPEKMDWEFVKWVLYQFPRYKRKQILKLLEEINREKQVIVLRSPKEVKQLLHEVTIARLCTDL